MNENRRWIVIIKRNKFWTFLCLLLLVLSLKIMLLLLDWWDIEVFVPPYEDINALIGISFSLIMIGWWIIILLLQLIKKWTVVINEEGIIDNYSAFSNGQLYPRCDIAAINYMWCSTKSLQKKLVITLLTWKRRKTFIVSMLTQKTFSMSYTKNKVLYYSKRSKWYEIPVYDYTEPRPIKEIIINNLWGNF